MAFGDQKGPPASPRRVRELLDLLQSAGHDDFRDARGPMGFTQRQAAGKFTRDEVDAFVAQLQEAEGTGEAPARAPRAARASTADETLAKVSAERLAAELQRRGWVVLEP
jgi:hypothetical protein